MRLAETARHAGRFVRQSFPHGGRRDRCTGAAVRLLDQVAQAQAPCIIVDRRGEHRMAGVAERAVAVREVPLRYILQPGVAARCRALLHTDRGMLDVANSLLRAPAPRLWIEWSEEEERVGLLVEADDTGRRGSVEVFWSQPDGEPLLAQARLSFDFDAVIGPGCGTDQLFLREGDHPLAGHLSFRLEPCWMAHLLSEGAEAGRNALFTICTNVLRDAEMLFAFSPLLLHRPEIALAPVDVSRINRHRLKRRRPPLLDHVEVSISLDAGPASAAGSAGGGIPRASRLHLVRGHMVHRHDQVFWRRSHLRGACTLPMAPRTVNVR